MAIKDEVLAQVSELLNRLNQAEKKAGVMAALLKHPIVVTVVGCVLIAVGSNWVTTEFQLPDKQSNAVAILKAEFPRELALTTHLAMVLSVLEAEGCDKHPNKKLEDPFAIGLTGKSCNDAEAEYLKYYTLFLEHPQGSSLVRVRALFSSPAVDEGAKKLGALIGLLSVTSENRCIVPVAEQAGQAYMELVDLAIQEIDGHSVRDTPNVFNLANLATQCKAADLCRVPAITKDPTVKVSCR